MQELGLNNEALGRRLGYSNSANAAGRVHALCDHNRLRSKSYAALQRLPKALELPADVIEQAVRATEQLFDERDREAEEQRHLIRETEDAAWRASFRPHAII